MPKPSNRYIERRKRKKAWKAERGATFRNIETRQLASFYRGMVQLYRKVIGKNYDAIIAPLRGADPFIKSIQLFASLDRKSSQLSPVHYVRIGARVESRGELPKKGLPDKTGTWMPSYDISAQKRAIKNELGKIAAKKRSNRLKLVIIDEAVNGGSILKNRDLLFEAAQELGLNVDLDTHVVSHSGKPKTERFRELVQEGEITEIRVERLFTSDNKKFLVQQVQSKKGEKLRTTRKSFTHRLNLLAYLQSKYLAER